MADAVTLSGSASSGGLSSLTKKQSEMGRARNPLNNNELNLSQDKKSGVVGAAERPSVLDQAGQKGQAAQGKAAQQSAPLQQIQGLQGNLGTFSLSLQAEMNKFLQGGTSQANVNAGGNTDTVYDAKTGMYSAPSLTATDDLSGIIGEKTSQQDALKSKAGLVFDETGRAKTLEEVLQKFNDEDGDGELNPEEKAAYEQQFQIVNELRRLKQIDPNSPEAESLQMQLMAQDKDGLVSGIEQAMKRYEDISGIKAVGAEEDYALKDLMNMGNDELVAEIEKGVNEGTGMFSGDYTANVKRNIDTSKQQFTNAQTQDRDIMQSFTDSAEDWLKDYDTEFSGYRNQLNSKFLESANDIVSSLEETKAKEIASGAGDGKWVDTAKQWFIDLQQKVKNGSQDFGTVIQQLLKQDGLNPDVKKQLEKWLGAEVGEGVLAKGDLAKQLKSLAETGYITGEDGKQIALASTQKAEIANILAGDGTSGEKQEKVQALIKNWSGKVGQDLETSSKTIGSFLKDGKADAALDTFEKAFVGSLKGFNKSVTQDFYALMTKQGVNLQQLGPQGVQDAITNIVENRKATVATEVTNAVKAATAVGEKAQADKVKLEASKAKVAGYTAKGIENTKNNVTNVLTEAAARYTPMISTLLQQYGIDPSTAGMRAEAYSFIQMLRRSPNIAKHFPTMANYLENPRYVLGNSAGDMEKLSYVTSMMKNIPYDKLFEETTAASSIIAKQKEIDGEIVKADEGIAASNTAVKGINELATKYTSEMDAVGKTTADSLFSNALVGGNTAFTSSTGADAYAPNVIKMRDSAAYTASGVGEGDANAMTAAASATGGEGVEELVSWKPISAPPEVVKSTVIEAINKYQREGGDGQRDTEQEPSDDGTLLVLAETKTQGQQYVSIPAEYANNPMGYLSSQSDEYLQAKPTGGRVAEFFNSLKAKLGEDFTDNPETGPIDSTIGAALKYIGSKLAGGAGITPTVDPKADETSAAYDAAFAENQALIDAEVAQAAKEKEIEQAAADERQRVWVAQQEAAAAAAAKKKEADELAAAKAADDRVESFDRAVKKPGTRGGSSTTDAANSSTGYSDASGNYFSGRDGDDR